MEFYIYSADCHFGKQVYELEETWNPDLGSPFGVMYCIRCECMAVSVQHLYLILVDCSKCQQTASAT